MDLVASIAARLHPLLRRAYRSTKFFSGKRTPAETGKVGEKIARLWLQREGVRILRTNYRADSGGEVDIVCRESHVLVFCEVKTRTSTQFGPPSRAVNRDKRDLIRKGARSWLKRLKKEVPTRFDIMEIVLMEGEFPHVHRIINAFGHNERKTPPLGSGR